MSEMLQTQSDVVQKAAAAKAVAGRIGILSTEEKNEALLKMADALVKEQAQILEANRKDVERGEKNGIGTALIDRLTLTEARIRGMADGLRELVDLDDPIGDVLESWERPNGLKLTKVRVPLGVIGIIYEARPNVTAEPPDFV